MKKKLAVVALALLASAGVASCAKSDDNGGKYTIGKYAVLGSGVFGKITSAATALYFNGTVAELANIRTKWNSNWNSDSKFTSIICTDNTYVI